MRILVLSNFYPPHYIGGYELGCHDAVEALKTRGHEVKVLTSSYGLEKPGYHDGVYRWLETDINWKSWKELGLVKYISGLLKKELYNQKCLKKICAEFAPDAVYIWKLTHTSISLVFTVQDLGFPVCYYVFDHWLNDWKTDDRWYRLWYRVKPEKFMALGKIPFVFFFESTGLLRKSSLDLRYTQFASAFLKQAALSAGHPVTTAEVIPWGIDVNQFPYNHDGNMPPRLLFVGRIIPQKGVHTIIEAVQILVHREGYESLTLTIVGGYEKSEYRDQLEKMVDTSGIKNNIHFMGFLPRDKIHQVYRNHEIFLFPSVWDEPFGIVILEAMSCGLAIIGTATGGSAEILQNDEMAALTFPKENAEKCATQIKRLLLDPGLLETIRKAGRHRVEEKFRFDHTIDLIEKSLEFAIRKKNEDTLS